MSGTKTLGQKVLRFGNTRGHEYQNQFYFALTPRAVEMNPAAKIVVPLAAWCSALPSTPPSRYDLRLF